MILHRCKTCNEERFENHFKTSTYYDVYKEPYKFIATKKCKVCLGKKIKNVEDEKYEVDFNNMMLVLTRLYFNHGMATDNDCILIMETYKDLYGENMPHFRKNIDRLSYMWERLKGFWNRNKEYKF